jgi:photosystem II stability/assembly factor-like uncharacterized protein
VKRIAFLLLIAGCGGMTAHRVAGMYTITALDSKSTSSMRGVSVVDARTAWASGTGGTVLRTSNGGATWDDVSVPGADSLDFRDIEAFDGYRAYVLSAGEDGRIYRTLDAGRTWTLQFRSTTKGAFFDCIDFWDARNGIAMSDPVDGRFLFVRTDDGENWRELPAESRPVPEQGEAAFAASGTCLVTTGTTTAYLATGGGAQNARVLVTANRGDSWTAAPTPVAAGVPAAGIFSLAFKDRITGYAVGGNYEKPEDDAVVAQTENGGQSWEEVGRTEYVSGAAVVPGANALVVVGTKGTRVSTNYGRTWVKIDMQEYNAVQFARDGTGYAVGPRGQIARISKPRTPVWWW